MQEEDVCDDGRLYSLCWARANSVEYASSHKTAVGRGSGTPDRRSQINHLREYVNRPSAIGCHDRNPDEVAKAKDEDSNASESYYISELGVEFLDVVREHRSESQRSKSLRKTYTACSSDTLVLCQFLNRK